MTKRDPVCGMQVDEKTTAATSMHQGQQYAFCSQQCKDKFEKSPERYARSGQQQPQQTPVGHEKVSR